MVTNLSSGYVEYCHVKTTPYLPVIEAVRMTLATPGTTTTECTLTFLTVFTGFYMIRPTIFNAHTFL